MKKKSNEKIKKLNKTKKSDKSFEEIRDKVSDKTEIIDIPSDCEKNDISSDESKKNSSIVDENLIVEKSLKADNKFKKSIIALSIGVFLSLLFAVYFLFLRSSIKFKYDKTIYDVDVFSEFTSPSVTACYGNRIKCSNIDVSIDSNVDTSKLGNYQVVYIAKYKNKSKEFNVDIRVVDTEAPIIETSKDSLSICPNASEFNIDYKAYDNYDGDLTGNVFKNVVDDILTLSVNDSSNNHGSKDIALVREDLEGPTISINGNSTMYLPIGSNYSEKGAVASDNCDGDVSSNISISGGVDTSKAGSYSIKYSVSDSLGNTSSATRNVYVYGSNGNGDKVVYLTFDDGPSAYTGELLDVLAKYNVKATFFVTNRNPNYAHFIKRAHDEGHTIALHTSSHNYSQVYASVDAYFNDLNAINETVKNMTGSYSTLIRFPGGSSNTVSRNYSIGIMSTLTRIVTERGYKYFDWNVSSGDADGRNHPSSDYSSNIINGINGKSMSIVLQHDTNINSIRSVSTVIEYGLSHGYTFLPLDMTSPVVHHKINN